VVSLPTEPSILQRGPDTDKTPQLRSQASTKAEACSTVTHKSGVNPWHSTPMPTPMGAKDVWRKELILRMRCESWSEDSRRSRKARQRWTPAHNPEGSPCDRGAWQNTSFLTALPCQRLPAQHAIHLEHWVPTDCRHQHKFHLDSKLLSFYLEGLQEDNSSESQADRWEGHGLHVWHCDKDDACIFQ